MAITLSCADLGSDCEGTVSGETVDEVVADMGEHAIEVHSHTVEMTQDPAELAVWRGAVKQSSRPPDQRTSRLDI